MLKIMRESAIERPWFYRSIMILIAGVFVVTMGWWGFEQNKEDVIIRVGEDKVSRDEYLRTYQNMYRFYKEMMPGDIPEDQLKQQVIDQLIESRLWTQAAKDMGVTVSSAELRDSIMKVPSFQNKGKFDPEQYRRVLAANRLTPAIFEASQRADLMREKARMLVRESVAPTSSELAEALVSMAGQPMPSMPMEAAVSPVERGVQAALAMKQQRAVVAFQEALKAKSKITVQRDLM